MTNNEQPKLAIIMRGIPGSGKSTVANMISEKMNGVIHSTDSYSISESGVYNFNVDDLEMNHAKNQEAFKASLEKGVPVVICDNTNTQKWEMGKYVKSAEEAGYWVVYITMPQPSLQVAVERNIHDVPEPVIKGMIENWEPIT